MLHSHLSGPGRTEYCIVPKTRVRLCPIHILPVHFCCCLQITQRLVWIAVAVIVRELQILTSLSSSSLRGKFGSALICDWSCGGFWSESCNI